MKQLQSVMDRNIYKYEQQLQNNHNNFEHH